METNTGGLNQGHREPSFGSAGKSEPSDQEADAFFDDLDRKKRTVEMLIDGYKKRGQISFRPGELEQIKLVLENFSSSAEIEYLLIWIKYKAYEAGPDELTRKANEIGLNRARQIDNLLEMEFKDKGTSKAIGMK